MALDPRLRGGTGSGLSTLTAHDFIPAFAEMTKGWRKAADGSPYSVTLPPVPPRRVSDFTTLPCRTFTWFTCAR